MKFSLSWLRTHLETDAALDEITVTLTRNKHEMPLTVTVEATSGSTIRAALLEVNC